MRERIFFISLALFCLLLLFVSTGRVLADATSDLKQAEEFKNNSQYEQAEGIYKQIITNNPGTDNAFQSQKELALLYIAWYRQPQADAAYQQLLANFSGHKDIAQAVHDIAYQYRCVNNQLKANQIDQYVVENWPKSDYAVLAQMDLTKSYVNLSQMEAAEVAFNKLLANFSGNALIARAVHDAAQQYRGIRKYQKANELYQYVISNWPKAEHALWAQADLVKSCLAQGDDTAAEAAVDKLLANFNDSPLIARAVWDTGQYYRDLKKYEMASKLYRHVIKTWPKDEHALWAQADLIKSCLAQGDDTAAEAAVDKLLVNFNDSPLIARAVWDTGQYYRDLKKYEEADRLYKHVVETWPKAEHALWAQADLIKSYLALADDRNTEAAVNKLIADFTWSKHIARAIHDTAWEYRKLGNYGKANELDQYVIDHWPQDVQVMWAKMDMAKTNIALGNYTSVEKTINVLIADFNDHPEMPLAIFMLGEEYYNKAFRCENEGRETEVKGLFTKAVVAWERIIPQLQKSDIIAYAYNVAADCYRRLSQQEKAMRYYQTVVDNWPNCEYAWNALFQMGRYYEELAKSGSLSESEAAPKIRNVYQQLLEKYPDCKAAEYARYWLSRHNSQ
jgi:tetratricopeptide (TPR) repeat protein